MLALMAGYWSQYLLTFHQECTIRTYTDVIALHKHCLAEQSGNIERNETTAESWSWITTVIHLSSDNQHHSFNRSEQESKKYLKYFDEALSSHSH